MAQLAFQRSDDPCAHCWDDGSCRVPRHSDKVYNDECALCCHTSEHGDGIYVCMQCFQGHCAAHVVQHQTLTNHVMFTRIHKARPAPVKQEELTDVSQIGVVAPPVVTSQLVCLGCNLEHGMGAGVTFDSQQAIVAASSPNVQETVSVNSWSHLRPCEHVLTLQQANTSRFGGSGASSSGPLAPKGDEPCVHCSSCVNNWLCLTCGSVGCPREEAGGKQHAIAHHHATGHPVVVKLGTITALGADLYCYACGTEVVDPSLGAHVATFGIDVTRAVKTSKSLGEQMIENSLAYDFSKITEAGANLVPLYGPGFTGLHNTGNTCYIASVLQCLFATPEFQQRYFEGSRRNNAPRHRTSCTQPRPQDCFGCQMEKLADGLLSGQFSRVEYDREKHHHLNGIALRDFKRFMNAGHADFATAEQQDAAEYLRFLLERVTRLDLVDASAVNAFRFTMMDRTECSHCHGAKYKSYAQSVLSLPILVPPPPPLPQGTKITDEEAEARRPKISLDAILASFLTPSDMDLRCEHCGTATQYVTTSRMMTFPDTLAVHVRREYFCRTTFQARKLDCLVDVPEVLDMSLMEGSGPFPGETVWSTVDETQSSASAAPTTTPASASTALPEVDELALVQLLSMGIDDGKARRALRATDNNFDRALDWVFSHGDDEDVAAAAPTAAVAPTSSVVRPVLEHGKPHTAATPALYDLFAMVSHIGSNVNTGHYVAHVKKPVSRSNVDEVTLRSGGEGDGSKPLKPIAQDVLQQQGSAAVPRWVLFNDDKVGASEHPPLQLASVYFYRRRGV